MVEPQIHIIRNNKSLQNKLSRLVTKTKMKCTCVAVRTLTDEEVALL